MPAVLPLPGRVARRRAGATPGAVGPARGVLARAAPDDARWRVSGRQRAARNGALAAVPPGHDPGRARMAGAPGPPGRAGGAMTSRLSVEVLRGVDALASLRREWEELFEAAPSASPFLTYSWMASWQATVGMGHEPLLLCARDGGRLVGLLALSERTSTAVGTAVRRVSFMGERIVAADGLDVLALPQYARPAAAAIITRLAAEPIDLLVLDGLPADSSMLSLLAWQFGSDGRRAYTLSTHQICPYLDLSAGWEGTLSKSRRPHQFGRLLRAVSGLDEFEPRSVTAPGLAGAALERLLALHDQRWAVQGGSDALTPRSVRAFHRRLVLA